MACNTLQNTKDILKKKNLIVSETHNIEVEYVGDVKNLINIYQQTAIEKYGLDGELFEILELSTPDATGKSNITRYRLDYKKDQFDKLDILVDTYNAEQETLITQEYEKEEFLKAAEILEQQDIERAGGQILESKKNLNDLTARSTKDQFGKTRVEFNEDEVRYEYSEEIKNAIFETTPSNITAKEALKNIINSGVITDSKTIELMHRMIISTKAIIKLVDVKDMKSEDTYMQYNTTDNTIEFSLDNLGDVSSIQEGVTKFIHEVLHDRTIRVIRRPKNQSEQKLHDDIKLTYDGLKDLLKENFPHEMSSIEEFVAGMFSNKDFESAVENIVNTKVTFWDKVVDFFKNLFNLDSSYTQLLDQIISLVDISDESYQGKDTLEAKYTINKKIVPAKKGLEVINKNINKTIEDLVKTTNRLGASTTYTDRLKTVKSELAGLLTKLEDGTTDHAIESIKIFNNFMRRQLESTDFALSNRKEFNSQLYERMITYNRMFMSMQNEIKVSLKELDKGNLISKEDYDKMFNEVHDISGISNRLQEHLKEQAIDNLKTITLFSDQYKDVYLDYERKYRAEGKKLGYTKYELDEYVNKELSRNRKIIEEETKDVWNEIISNPIADISSIGAAVNSEKDFNHPIIRVFSRILDNVKHIYQSTIQPVLIGIQSETEIFLEGNRFKSSDKAYENLVDWSEDGTGFLKGEYKIGYRESFNKMMLEYNDLDINDPLRKPLMKQWFKDNTTKVENGVDILGQPAYKTVPKDKWKNKLSKLSLKEQRFLDHIKGIAVTSDENYNINAKSLKKTTLGIDYYQIPSQHKELITRIKNAEGVNTFKEIFNDTFKLRTDDTTMGELGENSNGKTAYIVYTDISGKEIKYVPIHYRHKIDKKDQSIDLATLYSLEFQNSVKFKEKTKINSDLNMFIDVIQDKGFIKKQGFGQRVISRMIGDNETAPVEYAKEDSNLLKQLETMLNNRVYDKINENVGKIGSVDLAKAESFIRGTVSKAGMAIKKVGAPVNAIIGKSQTLLEVIKDPNIAMNNLKKAEGFFIKHSPEMLADMGRNVYKSLPNQLLMQFGGLVTAEMLQNSFEHNKTLAFTGFKPLFFFQEAGEHWIQAVHTMTILDAAKILDENGNYLDKNGKVTTKENAASLLDISVLENGNITTTLKTPFYTTIDRMKEYNKGGNATIRSYVQSSLIKSQGQYSTEYQSSLQRTVLGKMLFHFKKHILSPGLNRWRGAGTNIFSQEDDMIFNYESDLQRVDEGTYVTFLRYLLRTALPKIGILKNHMITNDWNEMDNWEKANIKRAVTELALLMAVASTSLLFAGAASDNGDDDDSFFWWAAALTRRMQSDLAQFWNINEAWRILKNPISTLRFFESSVNILGAITNYANPYAEDRNEKFIKSSKKMAPFIIPGIHILEDENFKKQYGFYNK